MFPLNLRHASIVTLWTVGIPTVMRLVSPALGESSPEFLAIVLHSQTMLASYLIGVGLLLLMFVEPPTRWWVGGDAYSGDWRPTLLAGGLLLAFVAVMALPPLRGFFALEPLTPLGVLAIVAAALAWLFLVRLVWRRRLLERFFGFQ